MFALFSRKEKVEEKSEKQNGQAKVYIWSGGSTKGIGHVAIEVLKNQSNNSTTQNSKYLSIWPTFPAIGPTSIIPLKAALANNLSQDIEMESTFASRTPGDPGDLCLSVSDSKADSSNKILPDKVFIVNNLNVKKINDEIERLKAGVDTGAVCYQLFPNVNTLGFLHNLTNRLIHDVDQDFLTTNIKPNDSSKFPEVYNCTTMVQKILKSGGMKNLPESSVWKPSSLADILKTQQNIENHTSFGIVTKKHV